MGRGAQASPTRGRFGLSTSAFSTWNWVTVMIHGALSHGYTGLTVATSADFWESLWAVSGFR